jgi:HlyD family secretion protein
LARALPCNVMSDGIRLFRDTASQDRALDAPGFWRRHGKLTVVVGTGAVLLAILVIVLLRFSGAETSIDRSRLTIATVERGSFVHDVAADGQVVAAVSPTLYAPAPGIVALKIHAGDTVAKGQVLATLESPDLIARLSQEEATLQNLRIDRQRAERDAERRMKQLQSGFRRAEVDRETTQRELDRSRKAFEYGAYSELQMLRAQDELEKAKFADEQAKSDLEAQPQQNRFDIDSKQALLDRQQLVVADLHRQVDALSIRSPVEGQVGQVQIMDRASVAKDAALLTVVDLSALEVEIKVTENLARDLKPGMPADLEGNGRHWPGVMSAVSPEVVNGDVTARVRFSGERPAGLRQSQRLAVRVFVDRRDNVLMVDRGAFMDEEGTNFLYLVRGRIAERHSVRLGAASVAKVEILEGASVGDRVVVSGTDAFHNAERVILSQ